MPDVSKLTPHHNHTHFHNCMGRRHSTVLLLEQMKVGCHGHSQQQLVNAVAFEENEFMVSASHCNTTADCKLQLLKPQQCAPGYIAIVISHRSRELQQIIQRKLLMLLKQCFPIPFVLEICLQLAGSTGYETIIHSS